MSKIKIEKLYVYIALFFGILFLVLTPPFESPDEDSHFKKSYQISNGNINCKINKNKCENSFPVDMLDYISNKTDYMGDRDKKYDYTSLVLDQYTQTNYKKIVSNEYSTNRAFFPVYIPAAVGIITAKVFSRVIGMNMISSSYMLYFARLFMLIATIFITYFAIKRTPLFKKSFFTIALLPMLLFLGSMVTYDGIINAVFLFTLAVILDLIYKKDKVDKKDIILLILCGVFLLNVKTLYFTIFILMFLIPKTKFDKKNSKIKIAIIMILAIIGITFLFKLPNYINSTKSSGLESKQISYIVKNPISYTKTLIKNIITQRNFQITSMVGVFGLLDTTLPFVIIFVIYLNIFMMGLVDGTEENTKIGAKTKILLILYTIFVVVIAYTSMYIIWTPYVLHVIGGNEITGVQGRYLIPILVPLMLLLSNKKMKNNKLFNVFSNNYYVLPITVLFVSVMTILLRFWI